MKEKLLKKIENVYVPFRVSDTTIYNVAKEGTTQTFLNFQPYTNPKQEVVGTRMTQMNYIGKFSKR